MKNPLSLRGQVALVTGAASGIGRGIAECFLREGLRVVIADLKPGPWRKSAESLFVRTDVSREREVRRCVREAVKHYGRLDVLVNNAGIADPVSGFSVARWQKIIGVNLTGAFLCAVHTLPYLKKAHGRMVNIASTRALMSEPGTPAYSASKGGLVALTHSLAITLGPSIRVNCISPGWIDTGHYKIRPQDHHQHPAGRVGVPDDIAELALYLVSPQSEFITGQNFIVDGGMTRKMIYEE